MFLEKMKIKNIFKNQRFLKDESALATIGNLCAPMGWMTCGALLETLGGTYFGCVGKLCTLCFPT